MKKVIVVGGVGINKLVQVEHFPEPVEQTLFSKGYHEIIGMPGTGKALNLSQLGFDVTLHGMLGQDEWGDRVRDYFKDRKNLRFFWDPDPGGTEVHINIMDNKGRRISIYVQYATFEPHLNIARLEKLMAPMDYVVFNINNYVRDLIPVAQKLQKEIWCDIHDFDGKNDYHRDFIESADCLLMSSNNMPDYRAFMEHLIKQGKKLILCTHGSRGSTALTREDGWLKIPIVEGYERVDTNGAGDSYMSGLLYGLAKNYSLERAMRCATITAGFCISSRELCAPSLSADSLEAAYKKHFGNG